MSGAVTVGSARTATNDGYQNSYGGQECASVLVVDTQGRDKDHLVHSLMNDVKTLLSIFALCNNQQCREKCVWIIAWKGFIETSDGCKSTTQRDYPV